MDGAPPHSTLKPPESFAPECAAPHPDNTRAPAASKPMPTPGRVCFTLIASLEGTDTALRASCWRRSLRASIGRRLGRVNHDSARRRRRARSRGRTPISTHVEIYSYRIQHANKHQMNWSTPPDEYTMLLHFPRSGTGRRGYRPLVVRRLWAGHRQMPTRSWGPPGLAPARTGCGDRRRRYRVSLRGRQLFRDSTETA